MFRRSFTHSRLHTLKVSTHNHRFLFCLAATSAASFIPCLAALAQPASPYPMTSPNSVSTMEENLVLYTELCSEAQIARMLLGIDQSFVDDICADADPRTPPPLLNPEQYDDDSFDQDSEPDSENNEPPDSDVGGNTEVEAVAEKEPQPGDCVIYQANTSGKLKGKEKGDIPVCCIPLKVESAEAAIALTLINAERVKAKLEKLTMGSDLVEAAEGHSYHMDEHPFFSHVAPENEEAVKQFWNRVKTCGDTANIGECVAKGYHRAETVKSKDGKKIIKGVVQGWMESQGHKKILMDPKAKRIGIGYKKGPGLWTAVLDGNAEKPKRKEESEVSEQLSPLSDRPEVESSRGVNAEMIQSRILGF